jgi:dTDP-4-dehydrorhamnose 3,5-epimerase
VQRIETAIPDLYLLKPKVLRDSRGFFMETFNQRSYEEIGLANLTFVQDNLSSSQKGTIRGLHFQTPPHAQGKLVTVFQGKVLDVAVDIRKGSPTYGQAECVILDANDPTFFYIPEGFAHGFQVLSETCLFYYKCTNFYNAAADGGISWNDPALGIQWHDIELIVSDKDTKLPLLQDFDSPFHL